MTTIELAAHRRMTNAAHGANAELKSHRAWSKGKAILRLAILSLTVGMLSSSGGSSADHEYLEYVGRSILNYKDTHGRFPPPVVFDASGRRMHSWRVLLLPYIEATSFYDRYDFDVAWDDPANSSLADWTVVNERLVKQKGFVYPNAKAYPAQARRAYKAQADEIAAKDFSTEFLMVVSGDEPHVPSNIPSVRPEGNEWQVPAATDKVLIVQVERSTVHWTEPRDIVLTSPVPEWGISFETAKKDILGSVQVTASRVTYHDREATLKLLMAHDAAKDSVPRNSAKHAE